MATAVMRIDVATLGAGTNGESRTDGESGLLVTVTSTGSGTNHTLVLLNTADPSAPTISGTGPWTFTPTSGGGYTYVLRLTVNDGSPASDVVTTRIYGIRTDNLGLLAPGPNEAADPDGSLQNNGAAVIEASYNNESGNYLGWQPAMQETIEAIDDLARGSSALPDDTTAAYLLEEGANDYLAINTNNGTESIVLGNATTNPDLTLLGTGTTTLGGDAVITGDLTVNGTTTTVNSTNLLVDDPLILLSSGNPGTARDMGLILERGAANNRGFIWDETATEFAAVDTTDDGTTSGNVVIADYVDIHAGTVIADDGITVGGDSLGTLDNAYDFGGGGAGRSVTVDNGAVELVVDQAASTNYALDVSYGATAFTGTPHGVLVDWSGATSLSNAGDVYGMNLVGETNAGGGESVALFIDAGWDDGIQSRANVVAGDPGTENGGIDVNGTTYQSVLKVSNLGGSNEAQFILHRHSTTLGPILLGARSNSNDSTHAAVTAGQSALTLFGAGWTGTHYDLFGGIAVEADAGTISATSSPGRLVFTTTADGSNALTERLRINESGAVVFSANSSLDFDGSNIDLDPTGTFALDMDAAQTATVTLADALASALLVQEGANAYLDITTTNASEAMTFGNATTNPQFVFSGTGDVSFGGGVGTATQVLTSNGPGAAPTWQAGGGGGGGNTLDAAYDQGGAGVGRTITADNGAVEIADVGGLHISGAGPLNFDGTNLDLDPTGTFALDMDAAQTATITLADALGSALLIQEGANAYLDITTSDGAEVITLGNLATDPDITLLTAGAVSLGDNVTTGASTPSLTFYGGDGAANQNRAITFHPDGGSYGVNHPNSFQMAAGAFSLWFGTDNGGVGINAQPSGTMVTGANGVSIGTGGVNSGTEAVAIGGTGAQASATRSVAIGRTAIASGSEAIAIGPLSTADQAGSIAFGRGSNTDATDQIVWGGGLYQFTEMCFGDPSGEETTSSLELYLAPADDTAGDLTIHPSDGITGDVDGGNFTLRAGDANGADQGGGNLLLYAGRPTGTGVTNESYIAMYTAEGLTTSSTLQTAEQRMRIDDGGQVWFHDGTTPQGSTRSANTGVQPRIFQLEHSLEISEPDGLSNFVFYTVEEEVTGLSGAFVDTTLLIDVGVCIGVAWRVTTTITGCTSLDVGVSGATTRYGSSALTAGTTNYGADVTAYTTGTAVRLTATGGGASFTAGAVRVVRFMMAGTAPTQ